MITGRTKRLAAVAIAVAAAGALPAGAVSPSPATKVARVRGATPGGETIPNNTDTGRARARGSESTTSLSSRNTNGKARGERAFPLSRE